MLFATPKFFLNAIRAAHNLGWKPHVYIASVSIEPTIMGIARFNAPELTKGALSIAFVKNPNDPIWAKDKAVALYRTIMRRHSPGGKPTDVYNWYGMTVAWTMVETLRKAGANLTRREAHDLEPIRAVEGGDGEQRVVVGLVDRRFEVGLAVAQGDPALADRHAAIGFALDAAVDAQAGHPERAEDVLVGQGHPIQWPERRARPSPPTILSSGPQATPVPPCLARPSPGRIIAPADRRTRWGLARAREARLCSPPFGGGERRRARR